MNAFEAYQCFTALRKHFNTDSYDYHKYKGKLRLKLENFEKRRDRFVFEKLARHSDPEYLSIANIIESEQFWLTQGNFNSAVNAYDRWLKRNQSLGYTLQQDLENLGDDLDNELIVPSTGHPPLLRLYLSQKVCLETVVIITDIAQCFQYWSRRMSDDFVAQDVLLKVRKYKPFVKYDRLKMTSIVVDNFRSK